MRNSRSSGTGDGWDGRRKLGSGRSSRRIGLTGRDGKEEQDPLEISQLYQIFHISKSSILSCCSRISKKLTKSRNLPELKDLIHILSPANLQDLYPVDEEKYVLKI